MELVIAANPDPDSSLKYLMLVPVGPGRVFRTSETWPRVKAVYCHPVSRSEWPDEPDIVESIPLKSCESRGASIDVIADRGREFRSQIVFTRARGRPMVFWQAPRTRKQARPNVSTPTARAAGVVDLEITVDTRERYAYTFKKQQAHTVKKALSCGDYAVVEDGNAVAAVERKSLADLISSLMNGRLRFQMAELAGVRRAAVVIEDKYSGVFKNDYAKPATVADGIAELAIRYPAVPIIFCESRSLAEEWTYRFLGAAKASGELPEAPENR